MSEKKKVYYRAVEYCVDSYYELETSFDPKEDGSWIIEDVAEDYFHNHDGWDCTWPIIFTLHEKEGGEEISSWSVELQSVPSFSATKEEQRTSA